MPVYVCPFGPPEKRMLEAPSIYFHQTPSKNECLRYLFIYVHLDPPKNECIKYPAIYFDPA